MLNSSMKNLFLGPLRRKQTVVGILTLVLFVSIISFVLYEGTKKTVAIDANGEQLELNTHAKTVKEILEGQSITLADDD